MAFGIPSFRGFLQLMILIVTTSWTIHGMMVLNGLISKAKNPSGGIIGVIVFLIFFLAWIFMSAQFSVNAVENDHRLTFFGISLPWLAVVLLNQLPVLFLHCFAGRDAARWSRSGSISAFQAAGDRRHDDVRHPDPRGGILAEGRA